ncbi:MAG: type II toxin-antitoxin system RelE/ParE family toxin [Kiloniellales bacterium]|nr:type II toxin-antitoxin system RelE/ParE family toxin [Kiloniellales bacterium]
MKVTVKRTKVYERKIRKLLPAPDIRAMENGIAENPLRWPLVQGTGGVRKARVARPGGGKSGGLRTAYYFHAKGPTVYMLTVYAKNEMDNLSDADKAALMKLVKAIKAAATNGD